ncbi:MAG: adenosylcobinamide-phosphate synthase CbiB [Rhodanobacter sp.]
MITALSMLAAVLLDLCLGEPRRAHPLVAFGRWATAIERRLHADRRFTGVLCWCLGVVPPVALMWWATQAMAAMSPWIAAAVSAVVLYLAIGLRSLGEHAQTVASALESHDLATARVAVGRMVSRDVQSLDRQHVAAAATESVLENGSDAVFASLFWFALLGAPGVLLHRLANTLDAMWGYRTPRHQRFGWAAARIDDVLNLIPARLTAFTYASLGRFVLALRCWRTQARAWKSPNAGPVMAAGAGALGVVLGGAAPYHGQWASRPQLGAGALPDAHTIVRACTLVRRGVGVWLLIGLMAACLREGLKHA